MLISHSAFSQISETPIGCLKFYIQFGSEFRSWQCSGFCPNKLAGRYSVWQVRRWGTLD